MPDTHTTYPQPSDLTTFFQGCNVDTASAAFTALDLQGALSDAIQAWQDKTGWIPYLAEKDEDGNPVETTRAFDPFRGGRDLQLHAGLLSASSVSVFDTAFDLGISDDFAGTCYLIPTIAPDKNEPYTAIRFRFGVSNHVPGSIRVTGVWGRTLAVSDRAWRAIIMQAAADLAPQVDYVAAGGLTSMTNPNGSVTFGSRLTGMADVWTAKFEKAARDDKRITA